MGEPQDDSPETWDMVPPWKTSFAGGQMRTVESGPWSLRKAAPGAHTIRLYLYPEKGEHGTLWSLLEASLCRNPLACPFFCFFFCSVLFCLPFLYRGLLKSWASRCAWLRCVTSTLDFSTEGEMNESSALCWTRNCTVYNGRLINMSLDISFLHVGILSITGSAGLFAA